MSMYLQKKKLCQCLYGKQMVLFSLLWSYRCYSIINGHDSLLLRLTMQEMGRLPLLVTLLHLHIIIGPFKS